MAKSGIDISRFSGDVQRMVARLEQAEAGLKSASKEVFARASVPLIAEIQRRAPQSDKPHSRYKGGEIVATYQPGNLSRSFRKLTFRRSDAVWIGAKVTKETGGEFSGAKADGYYAHMVEFGTVSQRKKPFVRPAFQATEHQVVQIATALLKIRLKRYQR